MLKKIIAPILVVIIVISILYIITIIPTNQSNKDELKEEWEITFGGEKNEEGFFVFSTDDEGCIVTGYKESIGDENKDMLIIKFNKYGNEEWNLTIGGDGDEEGKALVQTADKGFIIVGKTDSYGNGENDVFVVKISEEGEKQWNKTFGGEKNDRANSIVETDDGGYVIVGRSDSFENKGFDVLIIKINALGKEEWLHTIGGEKDDEGRSIVKNNDDGYTIAAATRSYGEGRNDIWILNINSTGVEQWNKTYGYEKSDMPNQIIKTENGNLIIVGHSELNYSNKWSGIIINTDENGNKIWEKTIENDTTDVGLSSITNTDDGYISTGYIGPYGNEQDQLLVKMDLNGNEVWKKYIGGEYCDGGIWIQNSSNNHFYIVGYKDIDGSEAYDLWLIRTILN